MQCEPCLGQRGGSAGGSHKRQERDTYFQNDKSATVEMPHVYELILSVLRYHGTAPHVFKSQECHKISPTNLITKFVLA